MILSLAVPPTMSIVGLLSAISTFAGDRAHALKADHFTRLSIVPAQREERSDDPAQLSFPFYMEKSA